MERALSRIIDKELKPAGITASHLPVLVALKDGSKLTQKDLAAASNVEQPSMAQLLSRMERDGLIRREPSPTDKRSSVVSLTDLAMSRLDPGRQILRRIDDETCAVLSDAERKTLAALLHKLLVTLEPDTHPSE
ncbi:MarR family transcriptional regulator [Robbsia sp. KACC 23696]|uniref:MarR family winged helix-turn-helix transcriptional regulator n=1 Tax=Robbsia sp. KACC 23696 TaxID=3149231 RepID=UPI00325C2630